NCAGRACSSGNAQLHTGSLWNATVIVSTTASRSFAPARRVLSATNARYRGRSISCGDMVDIAVPFFTAVPATPPPWPGVVVVMEGNGISPQLLRVCERLAHEGYATVAPDLYWRFGGSDPDKGDEHYPNLLHSDGLGDVRERVG